MQILADDPFRQALVNLPSSARSYLAIALQEVMAAPTIADFAMTGLELSELSEKGFTLPVKENYQMTVASLVATLTEDNKLKVRLDAYF